MSKKIKSLNQLLIFDTCHAGGVDWIVSGLYDARMSILARQMRPPYLRFGKLHAGGQRRL